jgi:uncharacterized protein YecE (DUF72 family)
MKLYFGCAQWGYGSWVGSIYPSSAGPKDFLGFYADTFNAVELNPTYHQEIARSAVTRWKNCVGRKFKFCPKFPKIISHDKRLENTEADTARFVKTVLAFEDNLGCCFLQLPPYLPPAYLSILNVYLQSLPEGFQAAVELRPDWLRDDELCSSALNILKQNRAPLVIVDSTESRPYLNKTKLTASTAFVRFIAYGHPTDYERMSDWVNLISNWKQKGLAELYFFLHFPEEESSADFVKWVIGEFEPFF